MSNSKQFKVCYIWVQSNSWKNHFCKQKLLFLIYRLVTAVKDSWTSAVFSEAPENTWFGQVFLNNMDDSSYETFEKPSVKEVTKHHKTALWHDHTTAHGSEEFKTCQVNIFKFMLCFLLRKFTWYIICILGAKFWNMKMDFKTGGTWNWVRQWTLMMKIYDFCIRLSHYQVYWPNLCTFHSLQRTKKISKSLRRKQRNCKRKKIEN